MPNPVGALRHPLAAASDRPLPAILVRGIFFFLLFLSSLPFFWLPFLSLSLSALSPVFFSLSPIQRSVNILKRGVAVGGSGDEEDLRNADTAFPRLSGPLPFGASVFFSFYVALSASTPASWWSTPPTFAPLGSTLCFVRRLDANSGIKSRVLIKLADGVSDA